MLPEKRKELIILGASIIGVIIVILLMYNLAKFMHNRSEKLEAPDDAYDTYYNYYGVITDKDDNYQLVGINSEYIEKEIGLRSFYPINKMYYYNNHLRFYSDAINELRYDNEEQKYYLYELNNFYDKDTSVYLTNEFLIKLKGKTLSYEKYDDDENKIISENVEKDNILIYDNKIYYITNEGVEVFDFELESKNTLVVKKSNTNINLLQMNLKYLVYDVDGTYFVYNIETEKTINISYYIEKDIRNEYKFIALTNDSFIFQTTNNSNDIVLKKLRLSDNVLLNNSFILGNESIDKSIYLKNGILYAELIDEEENKRNVIMDIEGEEILKELKNTYITLCSVD